MLIPILDELAREGRIRSGRHDCTLIVKDQDNPLRGAYCLLPYGGQTGFFKSLSNQCVGFLGVVRDK